MAEQPGCGHDRGLLAADGIKRTPEKNQPFGGRWRILPNYAVNARSDFGTDRGA
jgi:hypothetical protein